MTRAASSLPLCAALLFASASFAAGPPAVAVGGACKDDAQCVAGAVCTKNVCATAPSATAQKSKNQYVPAIPFFYWERKDGLTRWAVPFLFTGVTRDRQKDTTEALAALIGYYHRDGKRDESWRVVFPLLWDHQHVDHNQFLLAPLFWWEQAHHGKEARFVSLVASWERNDDTKMKQLVLVAPPVFHRTDDKRDVDVVPPLFTRWRVKDDGSSGVIAGPFAYQSDPNGSTATFFPLYWRFWDRRNRAETQFLFPIFGFHRHPGAAGAFVGPVYGWRSHNDGGGWGAGIAPIAFFGRSGPRTHQVILPPLFARWADSSTGASTTLVGPAFAHRRADVQGWDAGLFPLLWMGSSRGHPYFYLPPIFFHRSTERGTTDVLGPLFVTRGRSRWSAGLAPIAFFGADSSTGRSHQVILPPLFVHTTAPDQEHLFTGLFYHRRDHQLRVDVLFPLLYLRRAPHDDLLVAPLAGWRRDRAGETVVVGPYVYRRNDLTHSRTHFLFPLFALHDAPGYHVAVQFPFFWRVHDGDEVDTTVFPLYTGIRSPTRSADVIWPLLFAHTRSTTATTTLEGPFWFRRRADGGGSLGLFPLFAWGRIQKGEQSSRYFGMPLAFWYHSDFTASTKIWAGLFFDDKNDRGYTAGLIPLAFAWRRGTATSVIAPFFWHGHDSAANSSVTVVGPFYAGKDGSNKYFGLFPLTFNSWRTDGSFKASLFPLFYFHKKAIGSVMVNPLFGWSRYQTGYRGWVGPIYWRRDSEFSSTALFPIVYFSRDRATDNRTRFIFPLYFDRRGSLDSGGREFQEYSPLVWRFHSVERTILVGLPLFFDVNSFDESRTTGLLPFFVHNRSQIDRSRSWVFPPILTWVRKRDAVGATDAVFFPLIWRWGGQNPTTVVFPFGWDFKRGDSRTVVFAPIGAHWKRAEDDYTLVLNMYYRRGKGPIKEGQWWVDVFPLAEFGHPRKGDVDWKVLEGLFGYGRTGRNRVLHLFWLFDIPLEPAPASTLSWFGSTPPEAREIF